MATQANIDDMSPLSLGRTHYLHPKSGRWLVREDKGARASGHYRRRSWSILRSLVAELAFRDGPGELITPF